MPPAPPSPASEVPSEAPSLERHRLRRDDRHVRAHAVVRSAGTAMTPDADFIAAMQQGIPPINPPDPLAELEASEGICAQESDE